ncbi:hypothetical protein KKH18_06120, partial [bacterium]|nr:hypothetical protein [bacterium]
VQLPNGDRSLDESPVWRSWSCYYVLGYVDETDSLLLVWRQNPSLHTTYGKRVSISAPLDTAILDEYTQLTELNQVAYQLLPLSDSTMMLVMAII